MAVKWYRNPEMLNQVLMDNEKELLTNEDLRIECLLKDENNLIKDHLELLEQNELLAINNGDLVVKVEKLKKKNKDVKVELLRAIGENKVKSINFKLNGDVKNSILFNQIVCILSTIARRLEDD